MAHLAIFQPDARIEARLGDALSGIHRVSRASSWPELRRLLAREALDGCIVDGDFPNREAAVTEMRRLRKRHIDLALVAYADVHESDLELYRFGGLGVDGVVLARRPPWAAGIRKAVERALASARAGKVQANLQGLHDSASVRAVAWAVEHATQTPSVGDFAAAQGMSRSELYKSLGKAGLPTPGRVLLWGRLLQAAAYLNRDGRTVEDTALRLGYSTASALSRAMQRETGESPGEVSRRGGLPFVHARLFHGAHPPRRRGTLARVIAVALLALWQSACAALGAGGSGLSAYNLVTPRALVQVLRYRAQGPNAEVYRHALAEPGEEDSTLERRLPMLEGMVFAKTGTISNVNSLSGYLVRQDGREVVFSLLSNGSGLPSPRVRAALDDVLKLLAGMTP